MVLKRQDDGEGRGLEGTLRDSLNHLLKTLKTGKIIGNITLDFVECIHMGQNVMFMLNYYLCNVMHIKNKECWLMR